MNIPAWVTEVLATLRRHGRPAFLVGGCVRDLISGREPLDYDVATAATVAEVTGFFPHTVAARHGTVTVRTAGHGLEVSTFKTDPTVPGPPALEQDLFLRDFTINAMALDENGRVRDPYGGREDLAGKIIRSPGHESDRRFAQDPLRMMRAVRFGATLGFALHPTVRRAILKQGALIGQVAPERIRDELNRILVCAAPSRGIRLLLATGLLPRILPEIMPLVGFEQHSVHHDKDAFEHTLAVLDAAAPRLKVRLAALLHDMGKPATFQRDEGGAGHFYGHHLAGRRMAAALLERLRYDRRTAGDVTILVAEHMSRLPRMRDGSLQNLVARVGEHNLDDLFDLQEADIRGAAPPPDFAPLTALREGLRLILAAGLPLRRADLAVNGNDLKTLGCREGPEIGRVLDFLLDAVRANPAVNNRTDLLRLARTFSNRASRPPG